MSQINTAQTLRTVGGEQARTLHIIQGEQAVSDDPNVVMTTLLGSCVAACLRDPVAGIGGMNHFLLPGDREAVGSGASERQAVHAMELLVNALLARGASRRRLEAKIFGGAATMQGLTDVGNLNAAFAIAFLQRESITIVGECLRGNLGRRIQYWPVSGRARRVFLPSSEVPAPVFRAPVAKPETTDAGSLELF
jgi:chemotaxis protein CheD